MPGRAADVGERVVYGLAASVGDSSSWAPNPLVFGERTPTGWRARTAVRSTDGGNTPLEVSKGEPRSAWLTPDGSEIAFGTGMPLGDIGVTGVVSQIYRAGDVDSPPQWLSMPTGGIAPAAGISSLSTSADRGLRTVAFTSKTPLMPAANGVGSAVYAYRDGALQIVSRLPDGTVGPWATLANTNGNGSQPPARTERNMVAGGGRFVLFLTGGSPGAAPIFVRDLERNQTYQLAGGADGKQPDLAYALSAAAGGPGLATVPGGLVFAARDAGRAYFFGLVGPNVPGALVQMYEADLVHGTVRVRAAITGAPLQLSADGQRMIFLTRPDGAGVRELRYWDRADPDVSILVGKIDGGASNTSGYARVFEPSDDRQTWLFLAAGSRLDPDHPNVAPNTRQLYRWTVDGGAPTCLTCEPVDGVARTSGVNLAVQDGGYSETLSTPTQVRQPGDDTTLIGEPGHGLSVNGRWVLFDSPDRLVAGDKNDVRDVYLWDRDGGPGGRLSLVTSGTGVSPSWALDLSPDGKNAFFSTREGLVPGDRDGAYDVYTARIGTGFPASPESCVGQACRPPVIVPAPPAVPASPWAVPVTVGAKKLLPEVKKRKTVKLRVRRGKATSRRITLQVRTPGPGRIRVRGKGLRKASRTAKRSTTYHVHVRLSKHARETLRKKRRVQVQAQVRFAPEQGKAVRKTVKWTIKRHGRTSGKGR